VTAKLYGYLRVPYEKKYVQNLKSGGVAGEQTNLQMIANYIIDNMDDDSFYIIGPGTTTRPIMEKLD
jgi:predicted polyphosphate/ATP-dependent NAD kinase